MRDPRIDGFARLLIGHSCGLKPGERVVIEGINVPSEFVRAIARSAKEAGGTPLVVLKDDQVIRELALVYDEDDVKLMAECELHMLRQAHAFIGLRGGANAQEYADVPAERMKRLLQHYIRPVHHEYRSRKLKWVALRWPTPAMAQRAGMSTEQFEDWYFEVCTFDYPRMEKAMEPLAELIDRTDRVRIAGPGDTDLFFSIAGMTSYKAAGYHNIPDGELFTAPIRDSVEGRIRYNVPSVYYGTAFSDVCLDFKAGKVIRAEANETRRLNELLDQDEGARYVGEFAFGVHPGISRPMQDLLFDEKIAGSIHLAQGNAYDVCDNGNRSAIHWDLILIQTPAYGGGEVWFDDRLISREGRFVPAELQPLNPENLACTGQSKEE
ncbi:MAG TPA: aminopeptidase [Allosphingosinicella sp.]|nr:aminopeptidase [Allosphingosinicella sp.]